ncbi:response regulator transcription factor [Oleiharenicola lentus]|uniref:Response regulator transcription factor n=1 Tax=Oleiharenicola lentus TaxID=2508720 RepID=A0A4Q1CAP4_9BACT|nr:response regulator transcription factor [Oleiharenicola lentus]RXK55951.1 response regulator transcription factor [Oleiharenicola lentus]
MRTGVVIVEDDSAVRENLAALINMDERLRLLGSFGSAEVALREIPALQPKLAVMDINLPRLNGIECVARLKLIVPSLLVLMLTVYEDDDSVFRALKAGANGYLVKRDAAEKLLSALQDVQQGGAPMSAHIARQVVQFFHRSAAPAAESERLSPRETEILNLLVRGLILKEVADQLGIGLETVRTHVNHIYLKLHVRSRAEAIVKYLRQHPE